MADYADLIPLKENETIVQRVTIACQATAHAVLANVAALPEEVRLAKVFADDPRGTAERLFFQVLTSTTILGKLANPNTVTDADLLASAQEIFPNLAKG